MNFSVWSEEKKIGTFRRKTNAQGTLSEASKVATLCYFKIQFEFLLRFSALEEKCIHMIVPSYSFLSLKQLV